MRSMEWLRNPVGMAFLWAVGWGFGGGLIELVANIAPALVPWSSEIDMWPQTLGIPGFIAGLVFAGVLRVAEGGLRPERSSIGRLVLWGVVTGLLASGIVLAIIGFEEAIADGAAPWIVGIATPLSAISAVASALLFRFAAGESGGVAPAPR